MTGVRSPVEKFLTPEEIAGSCADTEAAAGRPDPDRGRQGRPRGRGARRPAPLDGRPAGPDPGRRLGVLLAHRAAAVRVERGRGALDLRASPVHVAAADADAIDPATATARAYDLILNGFEIGGGSIRIHRPDVQASVIELLGLSTEEMQEQFGHMLEAFRYGAPPHGGIAFGWDRLVMLLADQTSITEVIAFPKTQSGADPMTGAPSAVDERQLRDLGIHLIAPPAPKED